jgi:hypothetical protein
MYGLDAEARWNVYLDQSPFLIHYCDPVKAEMTAFFILHFFTATSITKISLLPG